MKPLSQLPDDITRANQELTRFLREDLPVIAGVEAIKLITRNFEAEGFVDAGAVDKWPARKLPGITSPIMTQRAQLRNAARARSTNGRVEVGIDLGKFPHAQILQEGGTIPVSPAMRRFFWAMCYKHRKPNAKTQNGPAAFWLAMTRKKAITIPPRKYIALQSDLITTLNQIVDAKVKLIFN